MRDMIVESAKAGLVPESLSGMVALGILSTAAGGGVNIRSRGESTLNANLYILAIAKSGTGKGVTYSSLSKPLTDHNLMLMDEWREYTAPRIQADIELTEAKLKAERTKVVKGSSSDSEYKKLHTSLAVLRDELTREPRLTVGETTEQKLGMLLAGQPHEALGNHSSEARGLIQIILGKFSGGSNATGETIYLEGYSGNTYSIERAGRPDITLKNPCLSCMLMVQPDVIKQLMGTDSMTMSGFMPRFIMADVKADIEHEPETPHIINHQSSSAWSQLIKTTLETYRHASTRITIEVQPSAQEVLRDNLNSVRTRGAAGGALEDLTSYVARYGENLRKIALLLHIAKHASKSHEHEVSEDTAHNACLLADWFFSESLDILKEGQFRRLDRLCTRLEKILTAAGGSETVRDLKRSHTLKEEEISELVNAFPERLEFHQTKGDNGGRPSEKVRMVR